MTPKVPRKGIVIGLTIVAALLLTACSEGGKPDSDGGGGGGGGAGDNSGYTIAMVTHAPPGDAFWDKIRAGAEQAAANSGIDLIYSGAATAAEQSTNLQNAIDSEVDGIAVTLATPDAMAGNVGAAREAGIPVVAFNAGIDQWQDLGAQMYFGSDETLAGESAGERIAADGGQHPLCVIQEAGNVALEARCAGVKSNAPATENINVDGRDDSAVTSSLQAKLAEDPSIDYIVTLSAGIALDALKAMEGSGSEAKLITFDLNADAAQAIADGEIEFSIDQQPYVQGYMSVQSLYLNIKNGNDLGGGQAVLTGPSFVDQENIDVILPFAKNNTR